MYICAVLHPMIAHFYPVESVLLGSPYSTFVDLKDWITTSSWPYHSDTHRRARSPCQTRLAVSATMGTSWNRNPNREAKHQYLLAHRTQIKNRENVLALQSYVIIVAWYAIYTLMIRYSRPIVLVTPMQVSDLRESDQELKLILEMYRRESTDPRSEVTYFPFLTTYWMYLYEHYLDRRCTDIFCRHDFCHVTIRFLRFVFLLQRHNGCKRLGV